jgi:hypothetical protein
MDNLMKQVANSILKRFGILLILILCQLTVILAIPRALWALIFAPQKAFDLACGYDLLGNIVTNGQIGDYISTRAYRAMQEGRQWGCLLCRLLDWIQTDHCKNSPVLEGYIRNP